MAIGRNSLIAQGSVALDMLNEGLRSVVPIIVQKMLKVGPKFRGPWARVETSASP